MTKKLGRPRRFEPEQLRALIEQGLLTREIAARLGVAASSVQSAVHRYGLPPLTGKRPPRVQPWCPPHLWPRYKELGKLKLTAAERRAIIEQDIARERSA